MLNKSHYPWKAKSPMKKVAGFTYLPSNKICDFLQTLLALILHYNLNIYHVHVRLFNT